MQKAQPRRRRRSHWSEHSGWIGRSPRPSSGKRSDYSGTCSETQQKGCWREWICHHWFESRRPRCAARPQMLLWSGYYRWCGFLAPDCPARLCGQTAFWRAAMLLSSHRPSRYTAREPSTFMAAAGTTAWSLSLAKAALSVRRATRAEWPTISLPAEGAKQSSKEHSPLVRPYPCAAPG